ncbi:MAG: hypothetical protein FWD87_03430 [Spirochaetaceae bacterium]|nr:hypothetical protein [Spirochaetaceae bacterium]
MENNIKKILFVLYGDLSCNSAYHASSLANEMVKLGNECAIAIPANKESVWFQPEHLYEVYLFSDYEELMRWNPDVIHYWTPREVNRVFHEKIKSIAAKVIIHLEDNEINITMNSLGLSHEEVNDSSLEQLKNMPSALSHPVYYKEFIKKANGYTLLIDDLKEFIDQDKPSCVFWPAADNNIFYQNEHIDDEEKRKLGIKSNELTVVYNGNAHNSNYLEVRSLYVAIALLNREGIPVKIIRTGIDYVNFWGNDKSWYSEYEISLGFIERNRIPKIMSLSDIFIQPGRDDTFNKYRFPSKLPEFFSIGKPVILPKTNIGKYLVHKEEAYVLDVADAVSIVEAVKEIVNDKDFYRTLATGARKFYEKNLSWKKNAEKVLEFYNTL